MVACREEPMLARSSHHGFRSFNVSLGGARWQKKIRSGPCSVSGLYLPSDCPLRIESLRVKSTFWGRKNSFQARMRTDSLSRMVHYRSHLPLGQRQIFNHTVKLFQTDLKTKFNSRTVLFFSLSAAEVLWFVLTLKIQTKYVLMIFLSPSWCWQLFYCSAGQAQVQMEVPEPCWEQCPTFQSNHSNYKTCNKTVSLLNE